jgi:hypothetical protein
VCQAGVLGGAYVVFDAGVAAVAASSSWIDIPLVVLVANAL